MSKIRVYELAKELGVENKAVLTICDTLGIDGKKSHSSTLSDDEVDKIRRTLAREAATAAQPAEGLVRQIERGGAIVTEQRKGNVIIRKRRETGPETEAPEAPARQIDLREAPLSSMSFSSLQPDLAQERNDRAGALARANALFRETTKEEEESEEAPAEEPAPVAHAEVVETPVEVSEPAPEVIETVEATPEAAAPVAAAPAAPAETVGVVPQSTMRGARVLGRIELPVAPVRRDDRNARGGTTTPSTTATAIDARTGKPGKKKEVAVAVEESADKKHKKKKQIIKTAELIDYNSDRDAWKGRKDKRSKRRDDGGSGDPTQRTIVKSVKMNNTISVGDLAKEMGVKAIEVMTHLLNLGVKATINQIIDFDTAQLVCAEFDVTVTNTGRDDEGLLSSLRGASDEADKLKLRPPVVTVMGHVDHGKTSLLDAIRKTTVVKGEAGGITQHIGAYNVPIATGGSVTFLDTPGHEAFTAMRSRGAKVTDIVVLVVAADDGVMPQTVEAINHAKAAKVPIIVAINKIDKEGANLDRIKTQLSENGLIPEEWGGDTILVPVSAHTRQNLDLLLENLYAQAEILDLRANPDRSAVGAVVESRLDKGRGPVMTVLIQNGTLKKGDTFVCGAVSGRVRLLIGSDGTQIDSVGPGVPAEVIGASATALAGDDFYVMDSDSEARRIAEDRSERMRSKAGAVSVGSGGPLTMETLSARMVEAGLKDLPIIIKGDVHGSVEAIREALSGLQNNEAKVKILHSAVGTITDNDIQLASASNALVIGFSVRAEPRTAQLAEQHGVRIIYSRIIYELIDQVKYALEGMLAPQFKETALGRVEVRDTFKVPKFGLVAGSYVLDGSVQRGAMVRLLRDNRIIHEGKMSSLRRFKDDVKEVQAGYECGIGIEGYQDIKSGDIIEVYKVEEVIRPALSAQG